MVNFKTDADFLKTIKFLIKISNAIKTGKVDYYGQLGVEALKSATPKDTGKTAESWNYSIVKGLDFLTIKWDNSNENDGVNIAIILQYGHATKEGSFVKGIDYINPAMKPVFEQISKDLWEEIRV